jgi:hypothetical protein
MANSMGEVDAVDSMRHATLYVTIRRDAELRWRWRLAKRLIRLAALVMNCDIDIS